MASKMEIFSKMPELCQNHVYMKDSKAVKNIMETFKKERAEKLMVLTDFDQTISKQHVAGKKCLSSFDVMCRSKHFPEEFFERHTENVRKYHPVLTDPKLSDSEKMPKMLEWFTKDTDLIIQYKVNANDFPLLVKENPVDIRDDTELLFKTLYNADVPVMVISAGVGEVVQLVLKNRGLDDGAKLHILTNFFSADGEGFVTGLEGERLHLYNKNEKVARYVKKYPELEQRKNMIVIGDSVQDSNMSDGLPPPKQTLKIGFLYGNVEEKLQQFMDHFDIVLVDDQTMGVVNHIVKCVLSD